MSRSLAQVAPISPTANSCGPCMTEKQRKQQLATEIKNLKATINFLSSNNGYDREIVYTIGNLVNQLIRAQGPLK